MKKIMFNDRYGLTDAVIEIFPNTSCIRRSEDYDEKNSYLSFKV